jgi:hypothetical protein
MKWFGDGLLPKFLIGFSKEIRRIRVIDKSTGDYILPHKVSPFTGEYKGKQVKQLSEDNE